MGNPHSRPEDRLRDITREVNSLRTSLRTSRQNISKEKKEYIVSNLALLSSEISSMHGKVKQKHIEATLKILSEAMEEILKIEPSELDGGAIESDSFINVPLNKKRSSSVGSLRSGRKVSREVINRSSVPTLRDIEAKVNELKSQISTAIDNKDTKQLRVYQETIKVLVTDLELIYTEIDTPLEKRKKDIDKRVMTLHQKVFKALKDLKGDDKIRNQSKQQKKDKAMNDLLNIEIRLAENESLLDKLIKEKNSSDFSTIRTNIVENNQKLAKVDIVDNEVKEKVVLLSQKLTEAVRTLDRIMAKREFESKFAKSLETYERMVRNFDANKNATDTKNGLENLRNSIQNLEEINETTKHRKKELLQNVNYQISNLNEAIDKESDKRIIEQIVEDSVVLRKKTKSDKEHTVIDQFANHWNNIKTNFNVNAYSNLSLLRIDSVLEEMQQSINDIRVGIANKCDINPPNNLSRKHSQSVPKLNTRKSYGSNKSLNQVDDKIIKTRAKLYNISTPELKSVEKAQQIYPNSRFSKVEEIKLQVHYIKEKVDTSHNKNLLKDKLEQYLRNLEEYKSDPNKTVSNNAALVSSEIAELLHNLVLAELKEHVDILTKRVQNFNGTKYDKEFDEMKDDLIKMQINLENFQIPRQYNALIYEKNELIDEVRHDIESLQEKAHSYRRHEDENVKQIKTKLQDLGVKVKRFSGTYKGVLYNSIERDLNKLLLDIGEHIEEKFWSDEITKETERLLKILEQRASLAQSFKTTPRQETTTEAQGEMAKIKRDLFNIKKEIDKTPENNVESFIGLQSRLDLVNLELSQISARSNENLAKEKEIFMNEAQTLKNVVDAKVALGQQPMVQWPERNIQLPSYPKNDVNKEIEQFEKAFFDLKQQITAPNNEQDISKFYELAQEIKHLMEKLNKYKFIRGTDLFTRKLNLLNEMQYYVEALEKGAIDIDYVLGIERNVDKLETLFDNVQQTNLAMMAEELKFIQNKLQEHNFITNTENLRTRKYSVQQKTEELTQKLKEIENIKNQKLQADIKKLDNIEEKVATLSSQVTSFIGLKSGNKYYELNEATINTISLLDQIEAENDDIQRRRIKLLKDMHALAEILNERALQTQEVANIEQGLEEVSLMLDKFLGSETELNLIKEKLEHQKRPIYELKVNNDLVLRKNACKEKYSVLFNKIMTLSTTLPQNNHVSQTSFTYTTYTKQDSPRYEIYNFVTKAPKSDDILTQIDKEIKDMENNIHTSNNANELQSFDDALTQYTIRIGNLKYTKESPQYSKVYELYQKIENLTDVIEGKLQQHDRVSSISNEIDEIINKMNTPLTYEQINQLDERLIQHQITLAKMDNPISKPQIDGCILRIIMCLQKISEYKSSIRSTSV